MKDLRGKNALLTGASGGLGRYIARELAGQGVNLALTALPVEAAELGEVAAEAGQIGVRAIPIPADVMEDGSRRALVAAAQDALGALDLLVNNAGITGIEQFAAIGAGLVQRLIQTNLAAPLLLTRLVLPGMVGRGQGHIVNMASMAGKVPTPYNSVYVATKAGLLAWTHALRIELAGTGVGVSAVCPSYVSGAGLHARFGVPAPRIARAVPPERVARAVVRAVQDNAAEVLVTAMPMRPLLAVCELWPGFRTRLLERTGFYAFARRLLASAIEKGDHA